MMQGFFSSLLSGTFSVTEAESLCEPGNISPSTPKAKKQKKPKKKEKPQELDSVSAFMDKSELCSASELGSAISAPASDSEAEKEQIPLAADTEEKPDSANLSTGWDEDKVIDLFGTETGS